MKTTFLSIKNTLLIAIIISSFPINGQTFTNYSSSDGLIDNSVLCATVDNNNNMWFGTQNGISKFDGSISLTEKVF